MEREKRSFIRPHASLFSSYIASLVALRLEITAKSHTMLYNISVVFSELCLGKKPKAIEISATE